MLYSRGRCVGAFCCCCCFLVKSSEGKGVVWCARGGDLGTWRV